MTEGPLILAVETSGRAGSVAIAVGKKIFGEAFFGGLMKHSCEIFPAILSLLADLGRKPKEIEQVYISVGPGSFTGLRIAVALAKTINLANAVKIIAVDTLDVIAANAADYIQQNKTSIERIAAILDAKRGQFFVAAYRRTPGAGNDAEYEKILPDCLMTSSQFLERFGTRQEEPIWLLGEGLLYYKDMFKSENIHVAPEEYWRPRASKVHLLGLKKALAGQFADPLTLQPAYIRRPEAEERWEQHKKSAKQ